MRVLITAHGCRFGGGVNVAKNLIEGLCASHPENRYLATVPYSGGYVERLGKRRSLGLLVYKHDGLIHRAIWERTILAFRMQEFCPDVIISLGNFGIKRPPCPQITLVQDSHLFYPEKHFGNITRSERWKFRLQKHCMQESLGYNDQYLCQTNVARRRFLAYYGGRVPVGLCRNLVPQIIKGEHPQEEPAIIKSTQGRFRFLVPAKYYAHKNLEIIPEILLARNVLRERGTFLITLSPDESKGAKNFCERIQSLGLKDVVHFLGQLSISQLYAYYHHCDGVFLPTLLESATAVYPEAAMFRKPLATSDLDFAREVCGEGTIFFNPWDRESVGQALENMMDNPMPIGFRTKRREEEENSWENVSEELHSNAMALARFRQVV